MAAVPVFTFSDETFKAFFLRQNSAVGENSIICVCVNALLSHHACFQLYFRDVSKQEPSGQYKCMEV